MAWRVRTSLKYFYFCTVEIITVQPAMTVLWQTKFPLLSRNKTVHTAPPVLWHIKYIFMFEELEISVKTKCERC